MYLLLKCSNINDLEKRVEKIETSMGKVIHIAGLSAYINKIYRPTYLSNCKDYLIVAAVDIEGGHGIPLDSKYMVE